MVDFQALKLQIYMGVSNKVDIVRTLTKCRSHKYHHICVFVVEEIKI